MSTIAILPVKKLENAKQRLAAAIGGGYRRALAEAMYADVLTALRRSQGVDRILVVTADRTAARIAEGYEALVIDDTGNSHSDGALLALDHARELGAARALLVPLDCPLIDPAQIDQLLTRPVAGRSAVIIPDRHGEGTNALLLTPPDALTPAFGEGSRRRHVELAESQGSTAIVIDVPTLALDIDTPEDLELLRVQLAQTRGGAAHTRGMLAQLDRSLA